MSNGEYPPTKRNVVPAILSTSVWWIVPLVIAIYLPASEGGRFSLFILFSIAIVASAVFCAANRNKE